MKAMIRAFWNLEEALRMEIPKEIIIDRLRALDPKVIGVELNWVHFGRSRSRQQGLLGGPWGCPSGCWGSTQQYSLGI